LNPVTRLPPSAVKISPPTTAHRSATDPKLGSNGRMCPRACENALT
jgi:hypothetical protein